MDKNRIEGAANQVKGSLKEAAGHCDAARELLRKLREASGG